MIVSKMWNFLLDSPASLGIFLLVSAASVIPVDSFANAAEITSQPTTNNPGTVVEQPNLKASTDILSQNLPNNADAPTLPVTNVSELSDVRPTDWAYEALRNLAERYKCLQRYPDGAYRGSRALSRYEFAAGLNACFQQLESLIARPNTTNGISNNDIQVVQRLTQEFRTELTTLGTRLDSLEGRTTFIEQRQFSTTTKLNGTVIFGLAGVAAGENALGEKIDQVPVLGTRTRLDFDTSFTGKDLLRTRFQIANLPSLSGTTTFTPEGDLRFTAGTFGTESDTTAAVDALLYSFPVGEKTTVIIEANAGAADDFTDTVNPGFDGDGDSGALSNFGTRNPIYALTGGAGLAVRHVFNENLELSLGYLATDPANSTSGGGLFNGPYGAIGQLTIKPRENLTVGLTYLNAYNNDLTAGSNRANLRSALSDNPDGLRLDQSFLDLIPDGNLATSSNAYGVQASLKLSPKFILGGWAGYTTTRTLPSAEQSASLGGDLGIWNYAVTLGFPDLGKEGSFAGIIVGMEPKLTRVSGAISTLGLSKDPDTSLHIEGFYQYQLTDNIAVTPGIIWLTAPDHNNANQDIVIGTVRTTFSF
ncbi:cyanobacterial porin [Crinalium epipsammum PCC 9333]|uniref:Cyanobacterial porin n=1 Tax=Crinalium epipsammum PCC 9333 TaxID=1173022 RepID=K9VXD0_9CYAN|nr:iron uptake porin [Crinalium epipsammum]AFZ12611.1 cyanobacterial porin [Crinalium epipsammum PCC 9333]